jgi:Glycosyl transferases group 1/DUF based on E. rectale Gene description (DUF3880)
MNRESHDDPSSERIEAWLGSGFSGTDGPLEGRSIELEEQLVRERASVVELEAERDVGEHALERERARVAALEARETELEGELRSRGVELARLTVAHDALAGERERLRAEAGSLRASVTHAGEQIRALEARRAALREEHSSARHATRRTAEELVRTQTQLAARMGELRALQEAGVYRGLRLLWRFRLAAVLLVAAAFALVAIIVGLGLVPTLAGLAAALMLPALGLNLIGRRRTRGPRTGPRASTRSRIVEVTPPVIVPADESLAAASVPVPAARTDAARTPQVEVDLEHRRALRARDRTVALSTLRVAGVLDEMSTACFAPDCELTSVPAEADAWRTAFAETPPDLLLVESAWAGNSGGWQYKIASYGHPDYSGLPQLKELLTYCRESGVPAVFWNKEDPVHFDRFKEAAALFDLIFTTDENCVARYQALEGVDPSQVHALPFAAQPRLHNPIAVVDERSGKPCFAGTYYRTRHEARREALEVILDAARPHDLVIYDRMFGRDDASYAFPERFNPHVAGRLEYDQTVRAYKSHKVFLNANSVIDSATMCSRRVFELLACETAVLSTPALAMTTIFGDTVLTGATVEEAHAHLDRLLSDEDYRLDIVRRGRRLVFREHSCRQRLQQIAQTAGLPTMAVGPAACAVVTLIEPATTDEDVERLATSIRRQSDRPTEILVGMAEGATVEVDAAALAVDAASQRVRVVRQAANDPSTRFRELAAIATTPWLAPFDPTVSYGHDYLTDLTQATVYTDADAVGVAGPADHGAVQRYARDLDVRSAMVKRDHLVQRGWPAYGRGASLEQWFREGAQLYAADVPDFSPSYSRQGGGGPGARATTR